MERYFSLVEKNPRRGTPLDRVYGYHVERGSLDAFIKSYRDRLDKKPDDGAAWLILGLLEFQRGQDAAAVTALEPPKQPAPMTPCPPSTWARPSSWSASPIMPPRHSNAHSPESPLVPTSSTSSRPWDASTSAPRKTTRHCKSGTVSKHLPGRPARPGTDRPALAEENQSASRSPSLRGSFQKAADPFRQVQLAIAGGRPESSTRASQDALHDFEAMLAKLRPDSWLHRDVRSKIEEVFLRNDDQAGLVAYYEQWTKKEPDDVEALVRLGRPWPRMGRAAEAQTWFDKAVKLAPSRRDLRLALISQLVQDQKFAEAAKSSTRPSTRPTPTTPTHYATGEHWSSATAPRLRPERKAAAAAIWRKMLAAKPNDPVTTAQVADLLRQAELTDQASSSIARPPSWPQPIPSITNIIGEYLHNLKRPDEAKAAWAKIAEGSIEMPGPWQGSPRSCPDSDT